MKLIKIFSGIAILTSVPVYAESVELFDLFGAWDKFNDPVAIQTNFDYSFDHLPMSGATTEEHTPWSDTYWPSNKGSIARRWSGTNWGFGYRTYSLEQLQRMRPADIARLSPAEKFDILSGRYDYPLVKEVWSKSSPGSFYWEGICHGWSPASLWHIEPQPVTVTNKDGIEISFGSSDIKAILSWNYAQNFKKVYFLGTRCDNGGTRKFGFRRRRGGGAGSIAPGVGPQCDDVNPGAFHVAMTNMIGIQKMGFVADVDAAKEVWNQPVYAYRSKVVGRNRRASWGAAEGAVSEITISTTIEYADEIEPSWAPVLKTKFSKHSTKTYQYVLELDAVGKIVGGRWLGRLHPDFMWTTDRLPFDGDYAAMKQLIQF